MVSPKRKLRKPISGWASGCLACFREFYLRAAYRRDLIIISDFSFPYQLRIEGDGLLFGYIYQEETKWGILRQDLDKDDPPVYKTEDEETWKITECGSCLSQWLLSVMYEQALEEHSEWAVWSAGSSVSEEIVRKIEATWPEIHEVEYWDRRVFSKAGQILTLAPEAGMWSQNVWPYHSTPGPNYDLGAYAFSAAGCRRPYRRIPRMRMGAGGRRGRGRRVIYDATRSPSAGKAIEVYCTVHT